MSRTVYLVMSELPDLGGLMDIDAQVVAIWSTSEKAERFAARYQRMVGRRLIVSVEEWAIDSYPDPRMEAA